MGGCDVWAAEFFLPETALEKDRAMVESITISAAILSNAAFCSTKFVVFEACLVMASKHPMEGKARAIKLVGICLSGNDDNTWQIPQHTALRSSIFKSRPLRLHAANEASQPAVPKQQILRIPSMSLAMKFQYVCTGIRKVMYMRSRTS
jgi:hypothetical protein